MIQNVYRSFIPFLFLLLLAKEGFSQPHQPYRLEIPVKHADKDFDIISLGHEGLALIRDLEKYSQGKKKWQVELIDSTLNRFWSTELDLENRLTMVGFEHLPGRLYLLFRETQTTYNNFLLATFEFATQHVQLDKVRFDLNFQLSHFTVAGTSALFGGYVSNEPAVLIYNNSSDHPKVLPGLFTKNISLLDVRANQNQSFNVLLLENRRTDQSKLIIRTFDPEGNLIVDDIIPLNSKYTIQSGITSQLIQDEMMIVGTYGEGNGTQSLGIYSVGVDPFNEQSVVYSDFASIDHFFDYLTEKKSRKLRAKAAKEKSLGKTPNYKANLLPIRLEEHGGSFYLLAEMYHPSSSVNYYPYSSPAWNSYYNPYMNPANPYRSNRYDNSYYNEPAVRNAEVRMIQSVLLKFKTPSSFPEGLSMKFEEVKRTSLDQIGDFAFAGDSVVIAYKNENEIFYQRDPGDPMIRPAANKTSTSLLNPTDILKDENGTVSGLKFWYANHFYLWGYRRVTATVDDDVQSRYVFYVNRLDF